MYRTDDSTVMVWHNGYLLVPDGDYWVVFYDPPHMEIVLKFPSKKGDVVQIIDSKHPKRHIFTSTDDGQTSFKAMPEAIVNVMDS